MNLVNELQVSAEQDDVLTVLRKTKRLAVKLGRQDISEWLNAEMNGYEAGQDLPRYRVIGSTIAYNTNGYVPAGFGYLKSGIEDIPFFGTFETPLRESISFVLSTIENLKAGKQNNLFLNVGADLTETIRSHLHIDPMFERQITFVMRLNRTQVLAIPEQIKDKVLDWACALESAGVIGEGLSFSHGEKEAAHNINISLYKCTVEQLNNLGKNQKG